MCYLPVYLCSLGTGPPDIVIAAITTIAAELMIKLNPPSAAAIAIAKLMITAIADTAGIILILSIFAAIATVAATIKMNLVTSSGYHG